MFIFWLWDDFNDVYNVKFYECLQKVHSENIPIAHDYIIKEDTVLLYT